MKKIIIDTNMLMAVGQFNVDIFSEIRRICDFSYKLYILDKQIEELDSITTRQRGKNSKAAKLALDLVKKNNFEIIKTETNKNVDSLILELVDKNYIVATQDKVFKQKLKFKNIAIIVLRQKRYLELMKV